VAKEKKNKNKPTKKKQVGKIYICGKGNKIYYKTFQAFYVTKKLVVLDV